MPYIIAIDEGTSSTRAMLYSIEGRLCKSSQQTLKQYYPNPGFVEHDAEEIWQKTVLAIKEVTAEIDTNQIIACGITNQRETTVIWDKKTGKCLHRAIVWQDRRTQKFCDSLVVHSELIADKTGLLPDPYFCASKINWLLDNVDGARMLAAQGRLAFGTIDSFLIWRLTGGASHYTDITNAARTMLFNIHSMAWDDELLTLFNIPKSILPEVRSCDDNFGDIDTRFLGHKIPITGVAGDQHASLIGQCCTKEGMAKATFGTGAFLLLNTGTKSAKSTHRLLTTIAYKLKGEVIYGLEGSIYQAGTIVKWMRDQLGLYKRARDTEALASSLNSNDGVYLVPSFTGLGAPHWLNTQGGIMIGLTRATTKAHFARAALESVCFQTRDVIDCMRSDTNLVIDNIRVDGGMAHNNWFLQYLASICCFNVQCPYDLETSAKGAAFIAAIGCGAISSIDSLSENWQAEKDFVSKATFSLEKDYIGWQQAIKMLAR